MTEETSNPNYISIEDEKLYNDLIQSKDLTLIHFFTPWSEQCKQMCGAIEEMIKLNEYKNVKFAKIQAEDFPKISIKDNVTAVPTIIFYKNGRIVDRVDGANTSAMVEITDKHLSQVSSPTKTKSPEALEDRLKRLINQAPCMLFMKGDPTTPRCGFSRTIVALLDSCNADYQTFDILQDNAVREGLKKFSDWPTYPQVYINGELIGGLDILKEMNESDTLKEMLPQKPGVEER
ncbi:glutaredoxin-3-like [Leptopilina boulardi]|uniref:glutaredoxin-3-like n=1 Tax=Leptopilina boulardi TaxID=63433 RepID=UPI0021F646DE|nr:glutaredoxin-3-like [Leptopilina boulardi]